MPTTVLITGASNGIGAALAARYAQEGARLGLLARNRERLEETVTHCRRIGAIDVRYAMIDVRSRAELFHWIERFDGEFAIDLVIANAGIISGTSPDGEIESANSSYQLFETNVLGVVNTIHPVIPAMVARKYGQIAIIGSLAGFLPMPDIPSYSASKACVLNYGLSLRELLEPHGIRVSVVCPGFVTTAMTKSIIGKKHFEMSSQQAAQKIFIGLARDRSIIAFPFIFAWLTRIGAVIPEYLRRLTSKKFGIRISTLGR